MLTKEEHIEYWINTSNDDFEVFEILYKNKNFLHALFIAHLSFEKLIKAFWVRDNDNNIPPKAHNLIFIVKQTKLLLSQEQMTLLALLNDFQIQGRYPDYKLKIKKMLTKEYVDNLLPHLMELRECLKEMIV